MTVESCPVDAEDAAQHARQVTRAEEQVIRSARTLYALSQQVAQFQDEVGRLNLRSADGNKKVFEKQSRIALSRFLKTCKLVQCMTAERCYLVHVSSRCQDKRGIFYISRPWNNRG